MGDDELSSAELSTAELSESGVDLETDQNDQCWTRQHFLDAAVARFQYPGLMEHEGAVTDKLIEAIETFDHWVGWNSKQVITVDPSAGSVALPPEVGKVQKVVPSRLTEEQGSSGDESVFDRLLIFGNQVFGVRGGGAVQRLAIWRTFQRNLKQFTGQEFMWRSEQGRLFWDDMPSKATEILITYVPTYDAYDPTLEICDDRAKRWIKKYFFALIMEHEGEIQSRAGMVGADSMGDANYTDRGEKKQQELLGRLRGSQALYPRKA